MQATKNTPQIAFKPYEAFKEIAATAPLSWARNEVAVPGHSYCVMLCDEADVKVLRVDGNRKRLEDRIGARVIPVLGDSVRQRPDIVQQLGGSPVVTLDVPVAGGTWSYWPAYPKPYEAPDVDRSGAVFVGRTDYPQRAAMMKQLTAMGIRMFTRDNEGRNYETYAHFLRSAAAVVNFCADRKTGFPQCKARVIEACLAGAVLLEQANPLTPIWLIPDSEYLEWSTLEELRTRLDWLERNPELGRKIAERGRKAVLLRLTTQRFWQTVEGLAA